MSDSEFEIPQEPKEELELSFLDHLEELRWRVVKALLGTLIAVVLCAYFSDFLVNEVVLGPIQRTNPPLKLINTIPYGQITLYMMVVLVASVIVSSPWLLYQLWKFVVPALYLKEKKYLSGVVFFTTFCFLGGVAFAYFLMLPYMLQFFSTFGSPQIQNLISVGDYMGFVLQMILLSGLIFELPMITYFLSKFGILTPAFMRHYRRHSIVAIFILAAILTPTTDAVTMAMFSAPMLILYEVSIWISAVVHRKKTITL
ncbi:MAG: twin-arginine translocase subunit TatC [Ignavibacteriales bacterium]|nr:twin-arginine translocase subunit TatC [Ignavibacteriales bacterium]